MASNQHFINVSKQKYPGKTNCFQNVKSPKFGHYCVIIGLFLCMWMHFFKIGCRTLNHFLFADKNTLLCLKSYYNLCYIIHSDTAGLNIMSKNV